MSLESGVANYVRTYAVVEVNFPIDTKGTQYIACKYCPFLSSNSRMCQLNKMPVAFPEKCVGDNCPLIRKDED